jgi:hypothetical protein
MKKTTEDKPVTMSVFIKEMSNVVRKQEFMEEMSDVVRKQEFNELKGEVSTLKSDVSVLKTDVSILKTDVKNFKNWVMENTATKADLSWVMENMATRQDINRMMTHIDKAMTEMSASHEERRLYGKQSLDMADKLANHEGRILSLEGAK